MAQHNILVTNPINHMTDIKYSSLSKLKAEHPLSKLQFESISRDLQKAFEFLRQEGMVCENLSDDLVVVQMVGGLNLFKLGLF